MENAVVQKMKPQKDLRPNYALYREYIEPQMEYVRFLVMRYIGNKNEVDEYCHLAAINLCKYIHTYDRTKSLKTWIHIVVKRQMYGFNKRDFTESLRKDRDFNGDFEFNGTPTGHKELSADDSGTCGENLFDNLSDEVMAVLQNIPATQLSAFMLHYQGYSFEEIAQMGDGYNGASPVKALSVSTVASRVYAAKRRLKKELAKYRATYGR